MGALLTLAYAPFNYWWITPIALTAALAVIFAQQNYSKTWLMGWFGLGWFGAGVSWVHVSIADFGGLPLLASIGLMAILCGYLALYPALALKITTKLSTPPRWPLVLPLAWFFTEWLRSWVLTGFPWLSLGYSQLNSPLAGWLPVIGETGVSALIILVCAGNAQLLLRKRWLPMAIVFAIPFTSGYLLDQINWTPLSGKTIQSAMVQGNIKQELRWVPEQDAPTMRTYAEQTLPLLGNELIVWPEAAIPKLESLAQDYIHEIDQISAAHNSALVTGIVNYNFETEQVFNNLIVLGKKDPQDSAGHYRYNHNNRFAKHHLLPIGEFVPFESVLRALAPIFDLPMSSFDRGDFQQRNLIANGYHIAPAICFEIAFPRQVRANLYPATDVILTVSNDAWFGRSHGPSQHMQIAQIRAKELGLPVIRSTNNGISGYINHRGEIEASIPQFERATTQHTIRLVKGTTPYRYFGDASAWLIFLIFAAIAIWLDRRTS
ncbi:apolipoprotein N-acyltransferase [Alteromonas flava]|uniref:apolipoprotein N-acyltransferase n=1 Tax=Alteromonas flava TaxID=2048003 RepID=UPI0013DD28F0|nr:apolipoprotein N-acyltransferase [Alteromonas flava]